MPRSLAAYQRTVSKDTSLWYMGSLLTVLAGRRDTGGAFSLIEATLKPGNEPPAHVHEREDELFYVLDGEVDGYIEAETFRLQPGGCLLLPRMKPHSFIVRTPRLRMLVLTQPGGIEGYFESMAASPALELDLPTEAVTYSTADIEHAVQVGGEYGLRFLSPDEVEVQMPSYAAALRQVAAA